MEPHRARVNNLIERAARNRNSGSKWDIEPPPKDRCHLPLKPKMTVEEQYRLYDR